MQGIHPPTMGMAVLCAALTSCENIAQPPPVTAAQTTDLLAKAPISPPPNDSTLSGLKFTIDQAYSKTRQRIQEERTRFATTHLNDSLLAEASDYFTQQLLNSVIPHWYGTTWDFNGHTDVPGEGEIACGYFVSTTLKHMGLKLNRYRMAQQSALSEAKTIAMDNAAIIVHRPEDHNVPDLSFLNGIDDGLYLVGLSFHVGYLYLKDSSAYFIHSDYISGNVRFENAASSPGFISDIYCLAPISNNPRLMRKWLKKEHVEVVMDE